MRVAVPFVKCVCAFADYVGSQTDYVAAAFVRPLLRACQQALADSLRTEALVHHQAADLGARVRLNRAIDEDRDPTGNLTALQFDDEHSLVRRSLHVAQALSDFF